MGRSRTRRQRARCARQNPAPPGRCRRAGQRRPKLVQAGEGLIGGQDVRQEIGDLRDGAVEETGSQVEGQKIADRHPAGDGRQRAGHEQAKADRAHDRRLKLAVHGEAHRHPDARPFEGFQFFPLLAGLLLGETARAGQIHLPDDEGDALVEAFEAVLKGAHLALHQPAGQEGQDPGGRRQDNGQQGQLPADPEEGRQKGGDGQERRQADADERARQIVDALGFMDDPALNPTGVVAGQEVARSAIEPVDQILAHAANRRLRQANAHEPGEQEEPAGEEPDEKDCQADQDHVAGQVLGNGDVETVADQKQGRQDQQRLKRAEDGERSKQRRRAADIAAEAPPEWPADQRHATARLGPFRHWAGLRVHATALFRRRRAANACAGICHGLERFQRRQR